MCAISLHVVSWAIGVLSKELERGIAWLAILVKRRNEMSEELKPKCKLIGTDGNVFALAGQVSKVLKAAGQKEKANEFQHKLMRCASYDDALILMGEYVEIE